VNHIACTRKKRHLFLISWTIGLYSRLYIVAKVEKKDSVPPDGDSIVDVGACRCPANIIAWPGYELHKDNFTHVLLIARIYDSIHLYLRALSRLKIKIISKSISPPCTLVDRDDT